MKLTFKQYNSLAELSEDEVTEEKLTEIFGAFFGNKSQLDKNQAVADLKAKKAGLQTALQQKTTAKTVNAQKIDRNKEWMNWVASQKAQQNKPPKVVPDKHGERRAGDFAYAQRGMKEDLFLEKAGVEIPYKGYKISKISNGQYRVTKGSLAVGIAKDYQEAMKMANKHAASPYKGYKFKKSETGKYHVTKDGRFVGHAENQNHAKQLANADMMKTEQTIEDLMQQYDLV